MSIEHLVIAEKPTAARKIAAALDATGHPVERSLAPGVAYLDITLFDTGRRAAVCSAAGHLYNLEPARGTRGYPVFDFTWSPVKKGTRKYITTMQRVASDLRPRDYVVATDYDTEGSVIGYTALAMACKVSPGPTTRRMRFSTLTVTDIRAAWASMAPGLDCKRVEAGIARHHVDAMFGVNFSRALTAAVKAGGTFKILSIGRVQGPTLCEVFSREQARARHVPEPYWTLTARGNARGATFDVTCVPSRFGEESAARAVVEACRGMDAIVQGAGTRDREKAPPPPFNLPGLQQEASRLFTFKPSLTLKLAEKLYLDALISYPRTESEIIPPSIDHVALLGKLASGEHAATVSAILARGKVQPSKGSKTDDAHPPILPTGDVPRPDSLSRNEKRLLDLITRRFLALFGPPATWRETRYDLAAAGHAFTVTCGSMTCEGWMACYPASKPALRDDPGLSTGDRVRLDAIDVTKELTRPPPGYSDMSLVRWMEREAIGTKSTRAAIVDVLKKRGYIEGDPFSMTPLGNEVVSIFMKHAPDVVSVDLTRELEKQVDAILAGNGSLAAVRASTRAVLAPKLAALKATEATIGKTLGGLVKEEHAKRVAIGTCPSCKQHVLVIVRTRAKKRSIMCEGRFDKTCDVVLPVIQTGTLKPTRKVCQACGFPVVMHVAARKKPWFFCINWAKCPATRRDADGGDQSR